MKNENYFDLRTKKRSLMSTNIHEVRTIETNPIEAPKTTVMEEEEEDEETKAYRQKIEEQKKIREIVFKIKEHRRLQAIQKQSQIAISTNLNSITEYNQQRPHQSSFTKITCTDKSALAVSPLKTLQNKNHVIGQQISNSNIRINTDNESSINKQHLTSFLSNRTIFSVDQSLMDTSIVVVSKLAAGTTDVKLRKMCRGIGDIKKLEMSFKERQATIQFNCVASAHAFYKKYQRTMLDLSVIQVSLKPMT